MKERITDLVLDIFRKPYLSRLWSIVEGRFDSLCSRIKFKKYFIVKIPYRSGLCDCRYSAFFCRHVRCFWHARNLSIGQDNQFQVFEQTKAIRLVLQKTADIERKARLFVLLSDPALRQPYEQTIV